MKHFFTLILLCTSISIAYAQFGTTISYADNLGTATCTYNDLQNNKHSYRSNTENLDIFWTGDRWEITFSGSDLLFYSTVETSMNPPNFTIGNWQDGDIDDGTTLTTLEGDGTTDEILNNSTPGDLCADANDINSLLGQAANEAQTSGIWDNTEYTAEGDPDFGHECFLKTNTNFSILNNSIWYSFTGDGETYQITTVECSATNYLDNGDTQMALYSGTCDELTAVSCNDDEDFDLDLFNAKIEIATVAGQEYFLMIDNFIGSYLAIGEFCVEVTRMDPVNVVDISATEIAVYPNPTSGSLTFENLTQDHIEILDNTGRVLMTQKNAGNRIDISKLASGLYFFRLYENETVVTGKVLKM